MKHIGWIVIDTTTVIELGVYSCYQGTFSTSRNGSIKKYRDNVCGRKEDGYDDWLYRRRNGLSKCIKVYATGDSA